MAQISIKNVSIRGVASCVPDNRIDNTQNPMFTSEEFEKFYESVGVRYRHVAPNGLTTSDMCVAASEKLMKELNWLPSEIDVIIFVTQTPDYRNPATSCIIQDRLGASNQCISLDVSLGCSGFVYGLSVIGNFLSSGNLKRGLLLVGDTATQTSSPLDKSRALLFGDAGTATAVEFDETASPWLFDLGTDGSGHKAIYTPHSGFRNRVTPESFEMVDYGAGIVKAQVHSWLDGLEVFSFGISRAPKTVKQLLQTFELDKDKIDYFLFHQANKQMNEKIRKKLDLPMEKVPYNIQNFGNCSSASIPLLMVSEISEQLKHGEVNLFMCGFGVGLSWGTCNIKLNNVVVCDLIELPIGEN